MNSKKYKNIAGRLLLFILIIVGFFFRIYGLNWDQGMHLHPDERFMTMVSSSVSLPGSIGEYFDSAASPLNPANKGYKFYVYGDFPLLITRMVAQPLHLDNYDHVYLVGRVLSAAFDTITIIVIFGLSQLLFKKKTISLLAAFFYAFSVFPVQQSHFFTVDSLTVLFITLTIFVFTKYLSGKSLISLSLSGVLLGLSLASKTSLVVTVPLFLFLVFWQNRNRYLGFYPILLFLLSMILSFRVFQPYAFNGVLTVSPDFIKNIADAHAMITGEYDYPPNIQWTSTVPILHPLFNIFWFGLGPLTTIMALGGLTLMIYKRQIPKAQLALLVTFTGLIFIYQSFQWAKYMRYFYPIYPELAIMAAIFFFYILSAKAGWIRISLLSLSVLPVLLFLNIYSLPHSRVIASDWICLNIPGGSHLSDEAWDDSLPLPTKNCLFRLYKHNSLPLYDYENQAKWENLNRLLSDTDYLVMSSSRLWGSIPKDRKRYPVTAEFYNYLFQDKTDFRRVADIYSYPGISLPFMKQCLIIGPGNFPGVKNGFAKLDPGCVQPGIYFRDDSAEESFTVYDHPQVLIFKKIK